MGLSLLGVDKIVGKETHLKGINLELESGSRNVILGRTLAGKTSLLRIIAGLDRPTSGRIFVDGKDVTAVSVRKRNVAMVYQLFINYPSLTVYDNIASPLKTSGFEKSEIDHKVRKIASTLHIEDLLNRLPAELSGGQQQRTAIARALVKESDLLLLDEPLVNLDYKLREELRIELQEIFKQREAIVIYTTTEPAEALMLGGNIIVIDEGRILQTGSTAHVYHHPANLKVAEVFSDPPINYIQGQTNGQVAHLVQNIQIPLKGHLKTIAKGDYQFGIRSNHLSLTQTSDDEVAFKAQVELAEINGSETFIHITHDGVSLVVQESGVISRRIGHEVSIFLNPGNLFVFDLEGALVASPSQNPDSDLSKRGA
jgi:glycerol transport system ATP-binding protein